MGEDDKNGSVINSEVENAVKEQRGNVVRCTTSNKVLSRCVKNVFVRVFTEIDAQRLDLLLLFLQSDRLVLDCVPMAMRRRQPTCDLCL